MRRILSRLFVLAPLILLVGGFVYLKIQLMWVEERIQEPDGLQWVAGDIRWQVRRTRRVENEVSHDAISVQSTDGREAFATVFSVDHDLFGMAIVGAMQVDDDPELEIVVWGEHIVSEPSRSFYLDFTRGAVKQRPFTEIAARIAPIVDRYRHAHQEIPLILAPLLLLNLLWYFVVAAAYLFHLLRRWSIRRRCVAQTR